MEKRVPQVNPNKKTLNTTAVPTSVIRPSESAAAIRLSPAVQRTGRQSLSASMIPTVENTTSYIPNSINSASTATTLHTVQPKNTGAEGRAPPDTIRQASSPAKNTAIASVAINKILCRNFPLFPITDLTYPFV